MSEPLTPAALLTSGQDFLRRAMAAYAEGDGRVVVTFAAIGLEHLLKAVLAVANPLLIADARDVKSLIALHNARHPPTQAVKTIGPTEALGRVRELHKIAALSDASLAPALAVRNGLVHAGATQDRDSRRTLAACLSGAQELLPLLNRESQEFWGPHSSLVASTLDEARKDHDHEVERLVAAARRRYELRVEAVGDAVEALNMLEADPWNDTHEERARSCPACGRQATCSGYSEIDWVTWDDESVTGTHYFYPTSMECPICGLVLRDERELSAAGIEWQVLIEDDLPQGSQ